MSRHPQFSRQTDGRFTSRGIGINRLDGGDGQSVMQSIEVRAALGTLEALGLAAVLVSPEGRILGLTSSMEAFDDATDTNDGILRWRCPAVENALRSASTGSETDRAKTIFVRPGSEESRLYRVSVTWISGLTFRVLLVTITDTVLRVPDATSLEAVFDLTKAEARVLVELGRGSTPRDIADVFGLSPETIRTQLKAVMRKTGTSRQADLIALIAGYH